MLIHVYIYTYAMYTRTYILHMLIHVSTYICAVSMGVPSDGSYGIEAGLMYSFPVICQEGGIYQIVQNLPVDGFSRKMMDDTMKELKEERDGLSLSLSLSLCLCLSLSLSVSPLPPSLASLSFSPLSLSL